MTPRRAGCLLALAASLFVSTWCKAEPSAAAPPPGPPPPEPVVADLSSHLIAISSGFHGASVVLFGATDGPADIIAVVRGPEQKMTVWRKGKIAGIWVNAESMMFSNVPSFYAVVSSRPVDEILEPAAAASHGIGAANLKLESTGDVSLARAKRFAQALVSEQERAGLFGRKAGKVMFLGDRLFRATIDFPANIPTGTYLVDVFLVRDYDVVSGRTTRLVVSKVGVDAAVSDFSTHQSALYGAIAVAAAVVAGWLASLPSRRA
ncbi:MAG: TIGR02186 family protein [Thiohalocapsa sp.]